MTGLLLKYDQISSPECVGEKAFKLAELWKAGLPVPEAIVVSTGALENFIHVHASLFQSFTDQLVSKQEDEPLTELAQWMHQHIMQLSPDPLLIKEIDEWHFRMKASGITALAIRSSGNFEDSAGASFAGQYETVLNVKTKNQLEHALLQCWASMYNERVLSYCRKKNIPHAQLKLGIIIQRMVPAEKAGVLFTVNPLTGNDKQMIIEAVYGVGEALVQGAVDPDIIHYDWYHEKTDLLVHSRQDKMLIASEEGELLEWKPMVSKVSVLSDSELNKVVTAALAIQQQYGTPQDIEWAFCQNELYILQTRPVTAIRYEVADEWTNADFKDGGVAAGVATPLMNSFYEYIVEITMPAYFKKIHIMPARVPAKWYNWFFGYPYWNMRAVKDGAKKIPGFIERKFDQSLGIEPDYAGDGYRTGFTPVALFNGLRTLFAVNRSLKKRPGQCKEAIQKAEVLIRDFDKRNFVTMTDVDMLSFARHFIETEYLSIEGSYWYTIYDNSNASTFFQEALEKHNKKKPVKFNCLKLVSGLQNLSHLKPVIELWDLTRIIRSDPSGIKFYSTVTAEELSEMVLANKDFSFSKELREYINRNRHHGLHELDLKVARWDEEPLQVCNSLKEFIALEDKTDPRLQNNKQYEQYLSEKVKIKSASLLKLLEQHRRLLWWREEMRDYSTRIYYLLRRIALLLGQRLYKNGLISDQEEVFFLSYKELLDFFAQNRVPYYQDKIKKNKIFYSSFRNFAKPNEIWNKQKKKSVTSPDSPVFKGIPCSPGIIKGEVVIVDKIDTAYQIKTGCILVTKFTDPAWTPVFSKIAGLVTETGGILSHGAVVSREYGIPAVLGIKDITTILQAGQWIELNGDTGEVIIIRTPQAAALSPR